MTIPLGPIVLAILAAAIGSLFASADAALTSLPEARLQALVEAKDPEFVRFAKDRLRLLSRWLVARVLAISLSAVVLADAFNGPMRASVSALLAVVI